MTTTEIENILMNLDWVDYTFIFLVSIGLVRLAILYVKEGLKYSNK